MNLTAFKNARKLRIKQQIQFDVLEGARLKGARLAKNISGKFVALTMGISPQYLADLEAGKRHWHPELSAAYEKAIGL